ncbi:hypothetical protein HYS10_01775 [Candidatus Collierbacteria bacterium]|nr:hypothetical protein [Candidatus Collierbacteria bacterium]
MERIRVKGYEPVLVIFKDGQRYEEVYHRLKDKQVDNLVADLFPADYRLAKTNAIRLWLDLTINGQMQLARSIKDQIEQVYKEKLTDDEKTIDGVWLMALLRVVTQKMLPENPEYWRDELWNFLLLKVG